MRIFTFLLFALIIPAIDSMRGAEKDKQIVVHGDNPPQENVEKKQDKGKAVEAGGSGSQAVGNVDAAEEQHLDMEFSWKFILDKFFAFVENVQTIKGHIEVFKAQIRYNRQIIPVAIKRSLIDASEIEKLQNMKNNIVHVLSHHSNLEVLFCEIDDYVLFNTKRCRVLEQWHRFRSRAAEASFQGSLSSSQPSTEPFLGDLIKYCEQVPVFFEDFKNTILRGQEMDKFNGLAEKFVQNRKRIIEELAANVAKHQRFKEHKVKQHLKELIAEAKIKLEAYWQDLHQSHNVVYAIPPQFRHLFYTEIFGLKWEEIIGEFVDLQPLMEFVRGVADEAQKWKLEKFLVFRTQIDNFWKRICAPGTGIIGKLLPRPKSTYSRTYTHYVLNNAAAELYRRILNVNIVKGYVGDVGEKIAYVTTINDLLKRRGQMSRSKFQRLIYLWELAEEFIKVEMRKIGWHMEHPLEMAPEWPQQIQQNVQYENSRLWVQVDVFRVLVAYERLSKIYGIGDVLNLYRTHAIRNETFDRFYGEHEKFRVEMRGPLGFDQFPNELCSAVYKVFLAEISKKP